MMGIPDDLFTPIFAIARVPGWAAHIIEEKFPEPPVKPELYRPTSEYTGQLLRACRLQIRSPVKAGYSQ